MVLLTLAELVISITDLSIYIINNNGNTNMCVHINNGLLIPLGKVVSPE